MTQNFDFKCGLNSLICFNLTLLRTVCMSACLLFCTEWIWITAKWVRDRKATAKRAWREIGGLFDLFSIWMCQSWILPHGLPLHHTQILSIEYSVVVKEQEETRRRVEEANKSLSQMMRAATMIQSMWRSYHCRKQLLKEKQKGKKKGKKGKKK